MISNLLIVGFVVAVAILAVWHHKKTKKQKRPNFPEGPGGREPNNPNL